MIYFILKNYTPNTAPTNRILGYLEKIDKEGIPISVIFLLPSLNRDIIQKHYTSISVSYSWKKYPSKGKIAKALCYFRSLWRLKQRLKRGDIIYTYGVNSILKYLIGVNGVKYYAETTENFKVLAQEPWPLGLSYNKKIAICKRLEGLFVISEPLKKTFISEGIKANRIYIINMTVDHKRFENIKKEIGHEKYIAYCGTASNNKDGVDELIKAFAIVAKQMKGVKLYIIGNTPSKDDLSGNLSLINKLNLQHKVVFTGVLPAELMPQMLTNASVLALDRPDSLQAKCGFPTKLGEYLLSKNPVVVTRVGDIPKFLEDGVSAILAEQRNPTDFANKILWLLEHPNEASIIGQRGYEVALRCFNNEIETMKMINVLIS